MPYYVPTNAIKKYTYLANPPVLDRVSFTIDHIHQGGAGLYSTYDIVRYLTDRNIPVTIFIQCTDPRNRCPADNRHARRIYQLNPSLVSFGAHSLSPTNGLAAQRDNYELIQDIIVNVTGRKSSVFSYHGRNAGPQVGVSYPEVRYARGIKSLWSTARVDNPFDTPVMPMYAVNAAFEYTRLRNLAGLSSTIFVHSVELKNGNRKKRVFDTFLKSVVERRIQAVSYEQAMKVDFSHHPPRNPRPPEPNPPRPPKPKPPTPLPPISTTKCKVLRHFSNNKVTQYLRRYHRDGVGGIYQVNELQRFLNELGFNAGVADGIFGKQTQRAVIAYQRSQRLGADGIVGRNTRRSINAYCD